MDITAKLNRGEGYLKYRLHYSCISHIGHCRHMNQDNFICNRRYMGDGQGPITFPLTGSVKAGGSSLFGIFDGLGGEDCGEIASLLAARQAAAVSVGRKPVKALLDFCEKANKTICQYAFENKLSSMGTTAALLAFARHEVVLCNIGDSRIFHFTNSRLRQISEDHVAVAPYGVKPPLSQNLGIPPSKLELAPYAARGEYRDEDLYLLCSDGLTDMLLPEEIERILMESPFEAVSKKLLDTALEHGGRDNITMIVCKVEKKTGVFGTPA